MLDLGACRALSPRACRLTRPGAPAVCPFGAGLTCNVVKLFMEMDSTLFDQCSNEYRERQEALEEKKKAQKKAPKPQNRQPDLPPA